MKKNGTNLIFKNSDNLYQIETPKTLSTKLCYRQFMYFFNYQGSPWQNRSDTTRMSQNGKDLLQKTVFIFWEGGVGTYFCEGEKIHGQKKKGGGHP